MLVEPTAGGVRGLGYTYADTATARLIKDLLAGVVQGRDAMAVTGAWAAMVACDSKPWPPGHCLDGDLGCRCGAVGFKSALTECSARHPLGGGTRVCAGLRERRLHLLLDGTTSKAACGLGRRGDYERQNENRDTSGRRLRTGTCRSRAIGADAELFVDANGAYSRKQALAFAETFTEYGVSWFEEPVSSDDLDGLRLIRDRAPAGMEITAGEYGYDLFYFRRMLDAGAVDVLQADATRCAGITGLLARRRALRSAPLAAVGALRTFFACPSLLRRHAGTSRRILSRPCAHRAHAVRRRSAHAGEGSAAPRPLTAWPRT